MRVTQNNAESQNIIVTRFRFLNSVEIIVDNNNCA